MNDAWLRAMERRVEIGALEKAWLSILLVASIFPLVVAVFRGSLFALVLGVAGLLLFVHSTMVLVAERTENRERVAEIREEYEALPPQEREYLDERFQHLEMATTHQLGRTSAQPKGKRR